MKDFRDIALSPFFFNLAFATVMVIIIFGLGPSLSPCIVVFITMRLIIQFHGCVIDLFWLWKIRGLPDNWWVAYHGLNPYVCPTKEKAAEMLMVSKIK